jgi:tRNA-binding protein
MQQFFWKDFENIELRVGTVIEVDSFTKARKPPDSLKISFGDFGIKLSNAKIQDPYSKRPAR